jgi:serine protease Do
MKAKIFLMVSGLVILFYSTLLYAQEKEKEAGFLGILPSELSEEVKEELEYDREDGVLVEEVFPGTPAKEAKLRENDIILGVDDEEVSDPLELRDIIMEKGAGTQVKLKIWREKKELEVKVKLAKREEEKPVKPPEEE